MLHVHSPERAPPARRSGGSTPHQNSELFRDGVPLVRNAARKEAARLRLEKEFPPGPLNIQFDCILQDVFSKYAAPCPEVYMKLRQRYSADRGKENEKGSPRLPAARPAEEACPVVSVGTWDRVIESVVRGEDLVTADDASDPREASEAVTKTPVYPVKKKRGVKFVPPDEREATADNLCGMEISPELTSKDPSPRVIRKRKGSNKFVPPDEMEATANNQCGMEISSELTSKDPSTRVIRKRKGSIKVEPQDNEEATADNLCGLEKITELTSKDPSPRVIRKKKGIIKVEPQDNEEATADNFCGMEKSTELTSKDPSPRVICKRKGSNKFVPPDDAEVASDNLSEMEVENSSPEVRKTLPKQTKSKKRRIEKRIDELEMQDLSDVQHVIVSVPLVGRVKNIVENLHMYDSKIRRMTSDKQISAKVINKRKRKTCEVPVNKGWDFTNWPIKYKDCSVKLIRLPDDLTAISSKPNASSISKPVPELKKTPPASPDEAKNQPPQVKVVIKASEWSCHRQTGTTVKMETQSNALTVVSVESEAMSSNVPAVEETSKTDNQDRSKLEDPNLAGISYNVNAWEKIGFRHPGKLTKPTTSKALTKTKVTRRSSIPPSSIAEPAKQKESLMSTIAEPAKQKESLMSTITEPAKQKESLVSTITAPAKQKESLVSTITEPAKQKESLMSTITEPAKQKESLVSTITAPAKQKESLVSTITEPAKQKESLVSTITEPAKQKESLVSTITEPAKQKESLVAKPRKPKIRISLSAEPTKLKETQSLITEAEKSEVTQVSLITEPSKLDVSVVSSIREVKTPKESLVSKSRGPRNTNIPISSVTETKKLEASQVFSVTETNTHKESQVSKATETKKQKKSNTSIDSESRKRKETRVPKIPVTSEQEGLQVGFQEANVLESPVGKVQVPNHDRESQVSQRKKQTLPVSADDNLNVTSSFQTSSEKFFPSSTKSANPDSSSTQTRPKICPIKLNRSCLSSKNPFSVTKGEEHLIKHAKPRDQRLKSRKLSSLSEEALPSEFSGTDSEIQQFKKPKLDTSNDAPLEDCNPLARDFGEREAASCAVPVTTFKTPVRVETPPQENSDDETVPDWISLDAQSTFSCPRQMSGQEYGSNFGVVRAREPRPPSPVATRVLPEISHPSPLALTLKPKPSIPSVVKPGPHAASPSAILPVHQPPAVTEVNAVAPKWQSLLTPADTCSLQLLNAGKKRAEWLASMVNICPHFLKGSCESINSHCQMPHEFPELESLPAGMVLQFMGHLRIMNFNSGHHQAMKVVAKRVYSDPDSFDPALQLVLFNEVLIDVVAKRISGSKSSADLIFHRCCQIDRVHPSWVDLAQILPKDYQYPIYVGDNLMKFCLNLPAHSTAQRETAENIIEYILQPVLRNLKEMEWISREDGPYLIFIAMLKEYFPELNAKVNMLSVNCPRRRHHSQENGRTDIRSSISPQTVFPNQGQNPQYQVPYQQDAYPTVPQTYGRPSNVYQPYHQPMQRQQSYHQAENKPSLLARAMENPDKWKRDVWQDSYLPPHMQPHVQPQTQPYVPPHVQHHVPLHAQHHVPPHAQHQVPPHGQPNGQPYVPPHAQHHGPPHTQLNGQPYVPPHAQHRTEFGHGPPGNFPQGISDGRRDSSSSIERERFQGMAANQDEWRMVRPYCFDEHGIRIADSLYSGPRPSCSPPSPCADSEESPRYTPKPANDEFSALYEQKSDSDSGLFDKNVVTVDVASSLARCEADASQMVLSSSLGPVVTMMYRWQDKPYSHVVSRRIFQLLTSGELPAKVFGKIAHNAEKGNSGVKEYGPKIKLMLADIGVNLVLWMDRARQHLDALEVISALTRRDIAFRTNQFFLIPEIQISMSYQQLVCAQTYLSMKSYPEVVKIVQENRFYMPNCKDWTLGAVASDEYLRTAICESTLKEMVEQDCELAHTLYAAVFKAQGNYMHPISMKSCIPYLTRLLVDQMQLDEALEMLRPVNLVSMEEGVVRGLVAALQSKLRAQDAADLYHRSLETCVYYPQQVWTDVAVMKLPVKRELSVVVYTHWAFEEIIVVLREFFRNMAKKYEADLTLTSLWIPDLLIKMKDLPQEKLRALTNMPKILPTVSNTGDTERYVKSALRKLSEEVKVRTLYVNKVYHDRHLTVVKMPLILYLQRLAELAKASSKQPTDNN